MRTRMLSWTVLLALVIVGLPLFAGGQADKAPAASAEVRKEFTSESITLTQWTFLDPTGTSGRNKVLGDLIKKFSTEHPNVKIVTEVQQWLQLLPKQTAAFYAGNAPDIMWNAAEYVSGILAVGAYEPFENLFLDEWTEADLADARDVMWGAGTTDGKHYFFDFMRSSFPLVYRADLFKKYGLSNKASDYADMTDFLEALTKFNGKVENGVPIHGYGIGYNPAPPTIDLVHLGLASAGELYTKDGAANFATKTGVQMMELQKAMIDDLKITPSTSFANNNDDIYNAFAAGSYAVMTSSGARITTHRKNATFDPMAVQLMPYPKINGKNPRTISGGWCIGVNSKSAHKYEAGKFLELLWSKEADWAFSSEAGQMPSRRSTYAEHPEFFQKPENQYILVLQECMDNHVIPIPPFQFVGTKEDLIGAFANYYLNGMTAMAGLQKAEKDFNERNKVK